MLIRTMLMAAILVQAAALVDAEELKPVYIKPPPDYMVMDKAPNTWVIDPWFLSKHEPVFDDKEITTTWDTIKGGLMYRCTSVVHSNGLTMIVTCHVKGEDL